MAPEDSLEYVHSINPGPAVTVLPHHAVKPSRSLCNTPYPMSSYLRFPTGRRRSTFCSVVAPGQTVSGRIPRGSSCWTWRCRARTDSLCSARYAPSRRETL